MIVPVVVRGDARALPLPDCSVDAVICDPPYELSFMGRSWDSTGVAFDTEPWREALRVLKPGGHLAAFGATRTYHRLGCAIEDAGFEIRDSIRAGVYAWVHGQGFPKSLDVGKAIDKVRAEDKAPRAAVCAWLADRADEVGVTRRQVDDALGTSDMGAWWLSRLPHRCATPTIEQWEQLRALIGFDGSRDAEVWRLNGRKGTPGEAWATAEVLATEDRMNEPSGVVNVGQGERTAVTREIKAANSDGSRAWSGWGTALKPAWEPIVCARKPLGPVPSWDEVSAAHHALGGLLWLSCSPAKRAELTSPSSSRALPVGTCASALASAATGSSPAESGATATYSSPALASTCSNIVRSWSAILAALSAQTTTFTTSTASSTTTALKTLNSLLAPITSLIIMPRCACLHGGSTSSAESAADSSSDAWANWRRTLSVSVPATAIEPIASAASNVLAHVAVVVSGEREARPSTAPSSALTEPATTFDASAELEPAWEPIVVARKPLDGTVAASVLAHGTGAINIDACRVAPSDEAAYRAKCASVVGLDSNRTGDSYGAWTGARADSASDAGRFPSNLLISHHPDCGDGCHELCHVRALDEQSGERASGGSTHERSTARTDTFGQYTAGRNVSRVADTGGASRFYPTFRYEPKAPTWQRPQVDGRGFETVKPLDLMRWLVRLLTPPGGLVLDMFPGTGTTGQAAHLEGFRSLLVELEADHIPFIRERLAQQVVVDRKTAEAVPVTPTPDDALSLFDLEAS